LIEGCGQKMKISKKEKILLYILGFAIIIAAYYAFLLQPQLDKVANAKEEAVSMKSKEDSLKKEIEKKDNLQKEFNEISDKVKDSTLQLFPEINQAIIIKEISKMKEKINFNVESVTFSEPEAGEINGKELSAIKTNVPLLDLVKDYKNIVVKSDKKDDGKVNASDTDKVSDKEKKEDNDDKSEESEKKQQKNVQKMTVNIQFNGDYNGVTEFMKRVEEFERKIIIKSLNIKNEEENDSEGSIKGSIVLDIYAIPKVFEQDSEVLKWDLPDDFSEGLNPFKPYTGYVSDKSISKSLGTSVISQAASSRAASSATKSAKQSKNQGESTNADFVISVKPFSADVPTVIMGKANDSTAETYAYADNKGYEDVVFEIFQEGTEYYYRYKTEMDSYPDDYANARAKFVPNGKTVNLFIYSNKRLGIDDNSGINLSLINRTDLSLKLYVIDDDPVRSRIKVVSKVGTVN